MGIYLIVCPLVFLAGFVDSIAGGGGLISLPAYMFAGIPVHNAIATNKLSSSTGTVVSTARLIKNKKVDWGFVPGTVIGALIGSVAGANLALIISDHILKMVLVVMTDSTVREQEPSCCLYLPSLRRYHWRKRQEM